MATADACNPHPSTGGGSDSSPSGPHIPFAERTSENVNVHLNILNAKCLYVVFILKILSTVSSLSKLVNHSIIGKCKHECFFISPKSLLH